MFKFIVVIIPLIFSVFLYLLDKTSWADIILVGGVLLMIIITAAAHFMLLGRISLATLPLGWALCLIPAYFYSYHLARSGYFGSAFTFTTTVALCIVPPGMAALLLSIISLVRIYIHK